MSAIKNQKHGAKDARRRAVPQEVKPADWREVNADIIQWLICNVAKQGGAVRFGYTRDGGAYALGIYGDGEPYTEYIRPSDDVDGTLRYIAEQWAE